MIYEFIKDFAAHGGARWASRVETGPDGKDRKGRAERRGDGDADDGAQGPQHPQQAHAAEV